MKTKKTTLAIISAILLLSVTSYDLFTNGFLTKLTTKLETYNRTFPEEKVYLHIDKPLHKSGEDIWFSAFIVDGQGHKPTSISEVLYVELIDPRGTVKKLLTLPIRVGRVNGDFELSQESPGGIYKVRSYTLWMKNSNTYFEKELTVQKVWTPKILMKLDFDREAYGPGDKVSATLELKDLSSDAIANHTFNCVIQLGGEEHLSKPVKSDEKGKAKITFVLPDSLNSHDGLLNAVIQHTGHNESISRSIPIVLNHIDLQFFPEGGDASVGVSGKIAFKALNEFGKAADIEGKILDTTGKEVQQFKSFHMGMGAFRLTPLDGQSYTAVITRPIGIKKHYSLPQAATSGHTLAVTNSDKKNLEVAVHRPNEQESHLIVQVRGTIYHQQTLPGKKGLFKTTIPLTHFPRGIAQVTLFDSEGIPKSERLVFVRPDKKMNLEITTDNESYGTNKPVKVNIKATNEKGDPVSTQLSMAVVNDQIISHADDKQDHITSYLLMSSDLKSDIVEPKFYFDDEESNASQALDYLLMTQGWRRFSWKEVMEETQAVTYLPEKRGIIAGKLVHRNKQDKIAQAKVYLFELGTSRKTSITETDETGAFAFTDVAPTANIQLMAQPKGKVDNWKIVLDKESISNRQIKPLSSTDDKQLLPKFIRTAVAEMAIEEKEQSVSPGKAKYGKTSNLNLSLSEDVSHLSEVVVTGLGYSTRSSLTGSVSVVQGQSVVSGSNLGLALQGRVPGVEITQQSGNSGSTPKIRIRGSSSLLAGSQPLIVVDGIPTNDHTSNNFSPLTGLRTEDIHSIQVLKGPTATALYGAQSHNGVVVVETKHGYRNSYQNYTPYVYHTVKPRRYSVVREFYQPQFRKSKKDEKEIHSSTLFWAPNIKTNENGVAEITFHTSNEVSSFRITAEGVSDQGQIGRNEQVFHTQRPFTLTAKMPVYLTFADTIQLPLIFQNQTDHDIAGSLRLEDSDLIDVISGPKAPVTVPADSSKTIYATVVVKNVPGTGFFNIGFENDAYPIQIQQEIDIQPKGFPSGFSYSGQKAEDAFTFSLQDAVPGSEQISFSAYPNILGDLMTGVESILQEPYGCFEQTSSSTYPNILALQFMKETGMVNNEIKKKATDFIVRGYKRLVSFETSQGGFEWFGETPPHEGLTAYGLMEFVDMKKVYSGVSDKLIARTAEWLVNQTDGQGGFSIRSGLDGFRGASATIQNAYIVYALSEVGYHQIENEYQQAYQEALSSGDAYRVALMANASFNLDKDNMGMKLLRNLWDEIDAGRIDNLRSESSITQSGGSSLKIETSALILLASLKAKNPMEAPLEKMIDYLISSRKYGRFGSTQGTILALKALTEYAKVYKQSIINGNLDVFYNNQPVALLSYQPGTEQTIVLDKLEQYITTGSQSVKVVFGSKEEAVPYTFEGKWHVNTPPANPQVKVDLSTSLYHKQVNMGATNRLTVALNNKTDQDLPMTVALIGIPSGLSLQTWQLKEQLERGDFDFYEIRKNYLVLYYRTMRPLEKKLLHFDLKAEVPGTYQAPASTAYLYYDDETKDWEAGTDLVITY